MTNTIANMNSIFKQAYAKSISTMFLTPFELWCSDNLSLKKRKKIYYSKLYNLFNPNLIG